MTYDILGYQKLPLDKKVAETKRLVKDYYDKFGGNVTVSFSGGMDSTALLEIARQVYPDIKGVFSDTGLEYPEVRDFVKTFDNIDIVKPKMKFPQVIEEYGYPVISKRVSRFVEDLQNPSPKNENTRKLRLTGISRVSAPGETQPSMMLPKKWRFLVDAPFKISDKCCDMLKKEPLNRYEKIHKNRRMVGVMADESNTRMQHARRLGPESETVLQPIIFWTRSDILRYIVLTKLRYCSIYGDIVMTEHGLDTTGEHRTGCMFCMFGIHMEKGTNRFERMKASHPNQYNYCINTLGCGKVLDFVKVKY
jgi:3'-phosphoadenosine 5'-phosphosulfate sulfotransferase (PAPS reductase)/FAD synthetase